MASATEEKIKTIIEDQVGLRRELIMPTSTFEEDLGFDSLDDIEFTMAIEEEFGIEIPDEDIEKLKTVQDVLDYLESHK